MKIGYSISFGVCDIHLGVVKIEDIKEIQAGTKYATEEEWCTGIGDAATMLDNHIAELESNKKMRGI